MFIGQNRTTSVESEGIEGEDNIFLENLNTWSSVVSFAAAHATLPGERCVTPVRAAAKETKARFTRQLFWHGTRLNLAPVPKLCGPAPSVFVV